MVSGLEGLRKASVREAEMLSNIIGYLSGVKREKGPFNG